MLARFEPSGEKSMCQDMSLHTYGNFVRNVNLNLKQMTGKYCQGFGVKKAGW